MRWLLLSGCAGLRLSNRKLIDGPSGPIIASPYKPEPEENCAVLLEHKCRLFQNIFKPVFVSCGDNFVKDGLMPADANYLFVPPEISERDNEYTPRGVPSKKYNGEIETSINIPGDEDRQTGTIYHCEPDPLVARSAHQTSRWRRWVR